MMNHKKIKNQPDDEPQEDEQPDDEPQEDEQPDDE